MGNLSSLVILKKENGKIKIINNINVFNLYNTSIYYGSEINGSINTLDNNEIIKIAQESIKFKSDNSFKTFDGVLVYSESFDNFIKENYDELKKAIIRENDFENLKKNLDFLKLTSEEKERVYNEFAHIDSEIEYYEENISLGIMLRSYLTMFEDYECEIYGYMYNSYNVIHLEEQNA